MNKRIQHYIVYYSNAAFPPIPKLGFLNLDKAERYVSEQNAKILGGDEWEDRHYFYKTCPEKEFWRYFREKILENKIMKGIIWTEFIMRK